MGGAATAALGCDVRLGRIPDGPSFGAVEFNAEERRTKIAERVDITA